MDDGEADSGHIRSPSAEDPFHSYSHLQQSPRIDLTLEKFTKELPRSRAGESSFVHGRKSQQQHQQHSSSAADRPRWRRQSFGAIDLTCVVEIANLYHRSVGRRLVLQDPSVGVHRQFYSSFASSSSADGGGRSTSRDGPAAMLCMTLLLLLMTNSLRWLSFVRNWV
jgi:hypothetical protein